MGKCNIRLNLLTINYSHLVEGVPRGLVARLLQKEIPEGNRRQGWRGGTLHTLYVPLMGS